ncbi:hypothetical protein [Methylacidiphilum kamchatkense]|nr:hypothetical protein [Methylacidiphilum kamchatkense]QDQ42523.1 hypothetical protein kam1_1298 [Methylacidiphilum kamchatkense Kam1]
MESHYSGDIINWINKKECYLCGSQGKVLYSQLEDNFFIFLENGTSSNAAILHAISFGLVLCLCQ